MEDLQTSATDVQTDNSESNLMSEIEKALSEPESADVKEDAEEGKQEPPKQQDNSVNCPDKFKNEDGTINVENLVKSYTELEPIVNERKAWETERAELLKYKEKVDAIQKQEEDNARLQGYKSAVDMQNAQKIARYEANEYAKYLRYLDDDVKGAVSELIDEYSKNPSEELMKDIEIEFAPEINKAIAVQADRMRRQFESELQQQESVKQMSNIEDVISKSVDANSELFKYEPFKNLFTSTLYRFGDRFTFEDAEVLMNAVKDLKSAFEKEFKNGAESSEANKKATDALAAITGQSSAQPSPKSADIDKLSQTELDKMIEKYI